MWLQATLKSALKEIWTLTKLLVFVLILLVAWGIAQSPPPPGKPTAALLQNFDQNPEQYLDGGQLARLIVQQLVAVPRLYTDNKTTVKKTG